MLQDQLERRHRTAVTACRAGSFEFSCCAFEVPLIAGCASAWTTTPQTVYMRSDTTTGRMLFRPFDCDTNQDVDRYGQTGSFLLPENRG